MRKIHNVALASLGALTLGATAWANVRQSQSHSATLAEAPPARAAVPVPETQGAAPKGDGFRASEFEGVSVRESPAKAQASASGGVKQGWIGVRPGAAVSRDIQSVPSSRSAGGWSKVPAPARLGGSKIVGPGLMHAEIGVRGPDGITRRECLPGESAAQHASHTAHEAHPAASKAAR